MSSFRVCLYCVEPWFEGGSGCFRECAKVCTVYVHQTMKLWLQWATKCIWYQSSLEDKHTQAILCHLFKIETEFVDTPVYRHPVIILALPILYTPQSRTWSYQHSFFPNAISTWNDLRKEATQYSTAAFFFISSSKEFVCVLSLSLLIVSYIIILLSGSR